MSVSGIAEDGGGGQRIWQSLIVVPTCGSVRDEQGELIPSNVTQLRLRAAQMQLWRVKNAATLMIVGGQRDQPSDSEAYVASRWFVRHLAGDCLPVPLAPSKYTAGDMVGLAQMIKRVETEGANFGCIYIVSHPDHAELARITLEHQLGNDRARQIVLSPSGEPAPYSPIALIIRRLVYALDPCWTWLPSLPFRIVANQRTDPPPT